VGRIDQPLFENDQILTLKEPKNKENNSLEL